MYWALTDELAFPPVTDCDRDGLLAFGGDLSFERLILAYSSGIFPWFSDGDPIMWWSLDPRMVMIPNTFKPSKSLRHLIRTEKFEVRIDTDFKGVMRNCAKVKREGQHGTWITKDMIDAYCNLHEKGFAHSFETYYENKLVGGLYGVSIGTLFCGESMFHTMTDASKVAFASLCKFLVDNNFELIDAQQETAHLTSLGAHTIPRIEYVEMIKEMVKKPTLMGNWGDGTAKRVFVEIKNDNE